MKLTELELMALRKADYCGQPEEDVIKAVIYTREKIAEINADPTGGHGSKLCRYHLMNFLTTCGLTEKGVILKLTDTQIALLKAIVCYVKSRGGDTFDYCLVGELLFYCTPALKAQLGYNHIVREIIQVLADMGVVVTGKLAGEQIVAIVRDVAKFEIPADIIPEIRTGSSEQYDGLHDSESC